MRIVTLLSFGNDSQEVRVAHNVRLVLEEAPYLAGLRAQAISALGNGWLLARPVLAHTAQPTIF